MTHVAAHNNIRSAGSSQRQILVILRIATLPNGLGWFEPLRSNDHNVKDALATLDGDEAIKLRAEDDLTVFVLDRFTASESSNRFDAPTARRSACSGRLFALRTAETKVEASKTTIKLCARPAKPQVRRRCPHPSGRLPGPRAWLRRSLPQERHGRVSPSTIHLGSDRRLLAAPGC
jgi:hypothetical protein